MSEKPLQTEIEKWQRWFAVECNNRTWDIASQPERTPEEEREMVAAAYAAAFHWAKVGTAVHIARADVTLAHALSIAGQGTLALEAAVRGLQFFAQRNGEDWDIAFAHLEVALAAYVRGDAARHRQHYALARQMGERIAEAEERSIFFGELAKVPAS